MKKGTTVLQAKRLEVFTLPATATLRDAAKQMFDRQISSLVVVDAAGDLEGVITRTDLIRAHLALDDWETQPVARHMTRDVITVTPQAVLREVADQLLDHHIHRVVVVSEEAGRRRPVSVVSSSDLIYHMLRG
jgi:CBS domain-containing protein